MKHLANWINHDNKFYIHNNINKIKENEVQVLDKIKMDKSMLDINFLANI